MTQAEGHCRCLSITESPPWGPLQGYPLEILPARAIHTGISLRSQTNRVTNVQFQLMRAKGTHLGPVKTMTCMALSLAMETDMWAQYSTPVYLEDGTQDQRK